MRLSLLAFIATSVFACSGATPANFAGTYNVTTVDGPNNCSLMGWMQGSVSQPFPVKITQDGGTAQIQIQGLTGAALLLILQTDNFTATVSGNTITSSYLSSAVTSGSCTTTWHMTISSTIDSNNNLSGTITLTPTTNGDASCTVMSGCVNQETLSGPRTGP